MPGTLLASREAFDRVGPFATDLLISGLVFLLFWQSETNRLVMKHRWVYVLALCTVGLSLALPLFLWAREAYLKHPLTATNR